MVLLATFNQKEHFVRTIFKNFSQDVSFKDVVFLVGDDQLAYHSQILRNVFPFLKNFLPNPGASCPCESLISNRSSVFVSLEGVSPSTVSTLMSSIYNQENPIFLSMDEMDDVKQLLSMLGADTHKYNIDLDAALDKANTNVTSEDKFYDFNNLTVKFDTSNSSAELLLNENQVDPSVEAHDTVDEDVMEECQPGGSPSSTVPHDEENSDLDESVEDEEITFSLDDTNQENGLDVDMVENNEFDSLVNAEGEDTSGSSVENVLDMVDDNITKENKCDDDMETNQPSMEKKVAVEIFKTNEGFQSSMFNERTEENVDDSVDEDIEVIAEVVDGITEVVHDTAVHVVEKIQSEASNLCDKVIDEHENTLNCTEVLNLEDVKEVTLNEVHTEVESDKYKEPELIAEAGSSDGTEEVNVDLQKDSDNEVDNENSTVVNNQLEEENDQNVEGDNIIRETKQDSKNNTTSLVTDIVGKVHLSNKNSNKCNPQEIENLNENNQEEDEYLDEACDDDSMEDSEDEENVDETESTVGELTEQKNREVLDSIDVNEIVIEDRSNEGNVGGSTGKVHENRLLKEGSDLLSNVYNSDDESDEDFDLETFSAPLEEVKRVKRDLSVSFDMDEDVITTNNSMEADMECNVLVKFKGDDLELITDISALKKRALSDEDSYNSDDEAKRPKLDDFIEDDQSSGYDESSDEEDLPKNDTYVSDYVESEEEELSFRANPDTEIEEKTTEDNKFAESESNEAYAENISENEVQNYNGKSPVSEHMMNRKHFQASVAQKEETEKQSDIEEDPDLFNIDEDDVDMLNEQTDEQSCNTNKDKDDKEADEKFEKKDSNVLTDVAFKEDYSISNEPVVLEKYSNESVLSVNVNTCDNEVLGLEVSTDNYNDKPRTINQPNIEDGKSQSDPPGLSCTLCPNQPTFKRGQLLTHLTDKHFSKDLLQLYPFIEGSSCQLCVDTSRTKVATSKTKANHIKHVGTVHEKVLELVPAELRDAVLAVSKRKAGMVTKEADCLESMNVLEKDSSEGRKNSIEESHTTEIEAVVDIEVSDKILENVEKVIIEAKSFTSGHCPFCPNTKTQFQRASLLNHLSSTHYNKQLLDAFPYQEGETCKLCLETGRLNPLIARSKPRYVTHMGSLHEKVLDLLPSNLRDSLEEVKKKIPAKSSRRLSVSIKEGQDLAAQLVSRPPVPGPSSSRGPVPGPSMRGPALGPGRSAPGPPSVPSRSLPKSLSVTAVPEERLASLGNLSISKVQEKTTSLPKLANVSISKVE